MNWEEFESPDDFLKKTGMSPEDGIKFLHKELQKTIEKLKARDTTKH